MERMLRFSLEHLRLIRLIWQEEDGTLRGGNVQVLSLSPDRVTFQIMRPRATLTLPRERILSADFKKGDDGSV